MLVALVATGLVVTTLASAWWRIEHPTYARVALPDALVPLDVPRGRALLDGADATADHLPILRWYVPQSKHTWSEVASAAIALNALQLYPPGAAFQQPTVLGRGPAGAVRRAHTSLRGLRIEGLVDLLDANGAAASLRYASDDSPARFRALASANLADPADVLLVHFDRGRLGLPGGGHTSPVAAWDRDTDRLLIADTAAFHGPWYWVRLPDLFAAMASEDPRTGRSRGYLTVRSAR